MSRPRRGPTVRAAVVMLVAAAMTVSLVGLSLAAPGALDPGFGNGGIVTTSHEVNSEDPAWSVANAVTMAPDGKIVVAGASTFWLTPSAGSMPPTKFFVGRYHTNGTRDTTLADAVGDPIVTDFAGGNDAARAVLVQPNGRIVAAGSATIDGVSQFALVRYLDDGTLDASFGDGGKVVTSWQGDGAQIHALALLPNGRIVAAGWAQLPGGTQVALARYRPNGTLDNSFGDGGRATLVVGPSSAAFDMARQPDGKLVVTGRSGTDLLVARFHANGSVDAGFGDGGTVVTPVGLESAFGRAVVVRPNGGIVAAATVTTFVDDDDPTNVVFDVALVSMEADGTLDPWFGIDHVVTLDVTGDRDQVRGLEIDAQGRLVVAATGSNRFGLARFLPHGDVDWTFGDGGTTVTNLGAGATAEALTQQADGKPVVAGHRMTTFSGSTARDVVLTRYLIVATFALDLDLLVTPRRDGLTDIVGVVSDPETGRGVADVRLRFLVDGRVLGVAATDRDGEARVLAPRGLSARSVVRVEVIGEEDSEGGSVEARYHPRTGIDTREPADTRKR